MKNIILMTTFLVSLSLCGKIQQFEQKNCDIDLKDVKCNYAVKDIDVKYCVSNEEFRQDIHVFVEILKYSYAGYDNMLINGFDEVDFLKTLINIYQDSKYVNVDECVKTVTEYLKPYIFDSHLYIKTRKSSYYINNFTALLYSDVYVEKKQDEYIVVSSDTDGVNIGDIYKDDVKYLVRYPARGKNAYRIALFTTEEDSMQRSIIFNNEPKMLFFKYRVDESEVLKSFYYSEKDQGCIYINFGSFIELSNKDLRNVGKLCRTKETIIIDLRNNPGGYSEYYTKFIESLCKSKIEENILESKYVMSPSVKKSLDSVLFRNKGILRNMGYFLSGLRQRKVYKKNQYIVYKFVENKNTQERKLNKNIIFITNKQTASTAEYSILLTRYLNSGSTLVIGENTSGCISYGNNLIYQLPNSNISLNLPSFETIFNIDPVKECYGILPDYWCTSEDVDKTISYILNEV